MPETLPIVWRDFSGGWQPSNDAKNGPKNALLQMDNLELDRNGALTLAGGTELLKTFQSPAHTLFHRVINGISTIFASLANGQTYVNDALLVANGDSTRSAFGTAFSYALVLSGPNRIKYNGITYNLGIEIPTIAPLYHDTVQLYVQPMSLNLDFLRATSGTLRVEGDILRLRADQATGVGSIVTEGIVDTPYDWSTFPDKTIQTDNDELTFAIGSYLKDSDTIQIDIALEEPDGNGNFLEAFTFFAEIDDLIPIDAEADTYGGYFITIKRSQFERRGVSNASWSTVYGFKITYTTPFYGDDDKGLELAFGNLDTIKFVGGDGAQDGIYEYVTMFVRNDGAYLGKSELGKISKPIASRLSQSWIEIHKPLDPQVTEIWVFRRGVEGAALLDQWYRVFVFPESFKTQLGPLIFLDSVGDQAALGIDVTVNLNLQSISFGRMPDRVVEVLGPLEGRWFYFTDTFMYFSDINNPDLIDVSRGVRLTSGKNEKFLWARVLSESIILVGTSIDNYILTGTLQLLPDGTIDIYYKQTNCKYPPVTADAVVYGGAVYYLANDGWRSYSIGGGNPSLTAPNLDRLYRGEACYGYAPINCKFSPGTKRFPIAINNNKLYCCIADAARIHIFDFSRNYWRPAVYPFGDMTAITTTQDGHLIGCFADNKLRRIDSQASRLLDGSSQQNITILTTIEDGGRPHNRKDAFTFTGRMFTGSPHNFLDGMFIKVITDLNEVDLLGLEWQSDVPPFAAARDILVDLIDRVSPSKTFQVQVLGHIPYFLLTDFSIDTILRPQQLTSYRFLNHNFGNACKKRLRVWPLTIDTLGHEVEMRTFGDSGAIPAENTSILTDGNSRAGGLSHRVYFTTDIFNVDYGFELRSLDKDSHGNEYPFELYDAMSPVFVQILPIAKRFDQVGPDELFKYGKIKQFEIRILPDTLPLNGVSPLPIRFFFNDSPEKDIVVDIFNGIEASYFFGVPKGTSGQVVRVEIGPTCYDFHRWYFRIQVATSGRDTELQWITLPNAESSNGF